MKGSSVYVMAILCFAILFGCLALSTQCHSSPPPRHHQQLKVMRTRGLFISTSPTNRSSYHTEVECPGDDAGSQFCAAECHCRGHRDGPCFCCLLDRPSNYSMPPRCFDKLGDCKARCPLCHPACPSATTSAGLFNSSHE
ncbi:hypothetical protein PVAP13_1KG070142 [Panicum virgatum]|uniref:Uncharacterized protein n=1 Tax=Panicum virgatum TaxID=38727 RepID=A0A8T0X9S9_PANVG|nr:hypothetical protein PVAP13_1KG070142 [Panicum virgatum]